MGGAITSSSIVSADDVGDLSAAGTGAEGGGRVGALREGRPLGFVGMVSVGGANSEMLRVVFVGL